MYGISTSSKEQINRVVSDLFDKVALRLVGGLPKLQQRKNMLIGFESSTTLANLFVQAMGNKWANHIEQDVLKGILEGAYSYIDILKNKTSNSIVNRIEGLAREAHVIKDKVSEFELNRIIQEELEKAKSGLETIAASEGTKTRNLGMIMDITRAASSVGDTDPVIGFAVIRDGSTCESCISVNLMPDGVTPKLYKLSEVSAGYFKRGDKVPSILGQHPHCFTENQRIATDLGLFTFKELFESQLEPKVLVDYRIKNRKDTGNQFGKPIPGSSWLDSHSKNDSYFNQATSVYDTGKQEILKITLDSGQELEVSLEHDMWVETGNTKWEKVHARNLDIGDKVPLMTNGESFGLDRFPKEAELMGNLLGDGTINEKDNRAQWYFFGNDIPYGEKLLALAQEVSPSPKFQKKLKISPPNNKYNVPRASFKSFLLGEIFTEEFKLTKKPRRVPERLFRADKETVSAFLRGLYAADGCSEPGSIQITQNDLEFLKEIQLLLSMFGFVSRIYNHDEVSQKTITYADGTEYVTNRKQTWRLYVGGVGQFNRFTDEIGFGVPSKQNRAEISKKVESTIRNYWRTAKVAKIENIGIKQTYCLTEPMTNTVTVNGIVTGQCRCTPFMVPSDWGFDSKGHIGFIGVGHDELDKQRETT